MDKSDLFLKLWFHYTDEERSYVILNAYKRRILKNEELETFMTCNRVLNWTNWLYPVVAYPLLK